MARVDSLGHFLTDVADAIREKKGTSETIQASDFDTEIENLPSGGTSEPEEKEVNFYDYDGTRIYSYTPQEFLALESMPANPSHEGLTAQGWNWSLADAQEYVEDYGICDIGQMYITDDGATRIYITLKDGRLEPTLGICVNGNVTIDWGDNSTEDTITGTSITAIKSVQHQYNNEGNYIIKIYPQENSQIGFGGTANYTPLIYGGTTTANSTNYVYNSCIKKIEFGSNIGRFNMYSLARLSSLETIIVPNYSFTLPTINWFSDDSSLKSIVIPPVVTSTHSHMFISCSSIKHIILPNSITTITGGTASGGVFAGCNNLKKLIIPNSVTSIVNKGLNSMVINEITLPNSITTIGAMAYNYFLSSIKIPPSISNIGASAFEKCYSMKYYDFSECASIPTLGTNAFSGIPSDCKIIVPDSLYEDWIAATNWSTYVDYIIKKTDWDALQ